MLNRIKDSIKVLLGMADAIQRKKRLNADISFLCPVCENQIHEFFPLPDYYHLMQDEAGFIHSIYKIETINHLKYSCPKCGASDRERLYALFLIKNPIYKHQDKFKFLDIAPSKPLQGFIKKKYPDIYYRSADLMMEDVDDEVDITDMTIYQDNEFDFVMCSHVLEHIEDDKSAMRELYRVLKPGGKGIVMVPILLSLSEDYENPSAKTPEERWKHFGQDDHVRFYSKQGFTNKLKSAGFHVEEFDMNYFGEDEFVKNGIHKRSVLYVVKKFDISQEG